VARQRLCVWVAAPDFTKFGCPKQSKSFRDWKIRDSEDHISLGIPSLSGDSTICVLQRTHQEWSSMEGIPPCKKA